MKPIYTFLYLQLSFYPMRAQEADTGMLSYSRFQETVTEAPMCKGLLALFYGEFAYKCFIFVSYRK